VILSGPGGTCHGHAGLAAEPLAVKVVPYGISTDLTNVSVADTLERIEPLMGWVRRGIQLPLPQRASQNPDRRSVLREIRKMRLKVPAGCGAFDYLSLDRPR